MLEGGKGGDEGGLEGGRSQGGGGLQNGKQHTYLMTLIPELNNDIDVMHGISVDWRSSTYFI